MITGEVSKDQRKRGGSPPGKRYRSRSWRKKKRGRCFREDFSCKKKSGRKKKNLQRRRERKKTRTYFRLRRSSHEGQQKKGKPRSKGDFAFVRKPWQRQTRRVRSGIRLAEVHTPMQGEKKKGEE